jgi:hypothetical protein
MYIYIVIKPIIKLPKGVGLVDTRNECYVCFFVSDFMTRRNCIDFVTKLLGV